ncbi:hypothetical protein [Halomicrococcus gelatinilyticus]|uniref:hypothetical protein n=1 Tax=Halomicrococcus gelatinilyticus TaxID=1702103 RepID=UPI002E165FD3
MNEGPRLLLVLAVVGTLLMVGFAGAGPALGGDASDDADSDDDTETNDDGTTTVGVDQDVVTVESDSVVRSYSVVEGDSVVSANGTDVSVELNSTQVVRSNGDQCRISISANESDATVRTCDEVRENGVVRTDEDGDVSVVVRSNSVDVDAVSVSNATESDGDD